MEEPKNDQLSYRPYQNRGALIRAILWALIALLVAAIVACAPETTNKGTEQKPHATTPAGQWQQTRPMRLLLAGSEARDSVAVATEFIVDQALRRALEGIPQAEYLTLNYRDSLVRQASDSGQKLTVAQLAQRLNLDGVVYTRLARFSSVLALEFRIADPATGGLIYRDLAFSMIRYRDSAGTMLLGPTLYDVLRKSSAKFFGRPDLDSLPVATTPLVITSIVIEKDTALGRFSTYRQELATEGVKALGEYTRINFPSLVAFDFASRNQVYLLGKILAVDDYKPTSPEERNILYNVGIDHYITGGITSVGKDSIRFRLELRFMKSRTEDLVVDFNEVTHPRLKYETSDLVRDYVQTLAELAQPMLLRVAEKIHNAYQASLTTPKEP